MVELISLDEQIAQLQARKKEQNKVSTRANLIKVVGNKNSTVEQLLDACYSFIGTHRLNAGGKKPASTASAPVTE